MVIESESGQIFIEQGVLQKNLKLQSNIRCRYWMKTTSCTFVFSSNESIGEKRE